MMDKSTIRSRAVSLSLDWDKIVSGVSCRKSKLARSIEDDLSFAHPGCREARRPQCDFHSGSGFSGYWNAVGMARHGNFTFPHGTELFFVQIDFVALRLAFFDLL